MVFPTCAYNAYPAIAPTAAHTAAVGRVPTFEVADAGREEVAADVGTEDVVADAEVLTEVRLVALLLLPLLLRVVVFSPSERISHPLWR